MAGWTPRPRTTRRRFIPTTICRRAIREPSIVVPANAGTHNHRLELLQKVSRLVPERKGTAYGSLRSQGRRVERVAMNSATKPADPDQPGAHLRLVSDRAA